MVADTQRLLLFLLLTHQVKEALSNVILLKANQSKVVLLSC